MPVGGSRHYHPGGAVSEGIWACPSCGEDNQGPIAHGCVVCGAGKPGHKVDPLSPPPPPPRRPQPVVTDEAHDEDLGTRWMHMHPEADAAAAYNAGYLAGIEAARTGARRYARQQTQETDRVDPAQRLNRTFLAALTLFRDQVLIDAGEEIASGEWCSIDEINTLIAKFRAATAQEAARV